MESQNRDDENNPSSSEKDEKTAKRLNALAGIYAG